MSGCSTKYNIRVTIKIDSGSEFSVVFNSAYKAFYALHDYIRKDIRLCYYNGKYDELMELLLSLRDGVVLESECSLFRLKAVEVDE